VPKKKDHSLIEVSNNGSVHDIIDVPTSAVHRITGALEDIGIYKETICPAQSNLYYRRHNEDKGDRLTYQIARIVDEQEDYEDSHDAESDTCDDERSENTVEFN
jgi:hypothetical protein